MVVDEFTFFRIYVAVKTHFLSNYNFKKYSGKTKVTPESLIKRSDYVLIKYISKQFATKKDAITFFVANMAYGNLYPLSDFEYAKTLQKKYIYTKESLTNVVKNDILYLNEIRCNKSNFGGEMSWIFEYLLRQKIHVETVAILDRKYHFLEQWMKNPELDLWKKDILRIKKLQTFIKFEGDVSISHAEV